MVYGRIARAAVSVATTWFAIASSVGCEIRTSTPSSQKNTRLEPQAVQEAETYRQQHVREEERERQRQEAARDSEQSMRDDARALVLRQQRDARVEETGRIAQKDAEDAERLRVSCLADGPARERARKDAEARTAKDEAKRKKDEERAAYLKKSCKRRERALVAPTDEICENDDGTLRRCEGVYGVEVVFDCPSNGPVGLRGTIVGGQRVSGQEGRIARATGTRRPTRDEICASADAAAITSSPAVSP